mmetsp:Transcript_96122/g.276828  ORF Transcript_96122/g.276828 Transcript_96122/m.276828 type:complete len:300 (-) Transcript_96122:126-1025(-)
MFNDGFGYAFARRGTPCVQIHTPRRHIARTRMMEILVALVWPLGLFPCLRLALAVLEALMLSMSLVEFLPLLLWPWVSPLGVFALPAMHLLIRLAQWASGALAADHRSHQKEIAAAVSWAQRNQGLLGSDGRLVLCGYSSGGHCAALYGITPGAPRFEAVVLISGIYGLRTHAWTGARKLLLAPLCDMLYRDLLGASSDADRDRLSPAFLCERMALPGKATLPAQTWYVLSAKRELMGLQPFEDILFHSQELCDALSGKGARVHNVTCGLNHWLLVLNIDEFVRPFCESLSLGKAKGAQ